MLAKHITAIENQLGYRLFVLKQEYKGWHENRSSIDILALDEDSNPVVIEIKRTKDAEDADLQALRYGAMVSRLTWQDALDCIATPDAESRLEEFLEEGRADGRTIGSRVRIVIISLNYKPEIIETASWLREQYNLDITLLTIVPHRLSNRTIIQFDRLFPVKQLERMTARAQAKLVEEQEQEQALSSEADDILNKLRLDSNDAKSQWRKKHPAVWTFRTDHNNVEFIAVLKREKFSRKIGLRLEVRNHSDPDGTWFNEINGQMREKLCSIYPDLVFPPKSRNASRFFAMCPAPSDDVAMMRKWLEENLPLMTDVAAMIEKMPV